MNRKFWIEAKRRNIEIFDYVSRWWCTARKNRNRNNKFSIIIPTVWQIDISISVSIKTKSKKKTCCKSVRSANTYSISQYAASRARDGIRILRIFVENQSRTDSQTTENRLPKHAGAILQVQEEGLHQISHGGGTEVRNFFSPFANHSGIRMCVLSLFQLQRRLYE